jgi:hypothetical protein
MKAMSTKRPKRGKSEMERERERERGGGEEREIR